MQVKLYDTTLRDGSQGEGISYSVNDKVNIAAKLDELGVHYIEAGWPMNPKDKQVFAALNKKKLKNAELVAFGSTRRADVKVEDDENIKSLLGAQTKIITVFGKTWDLHVRDVLKVSLDENLKMISDTVSYLAAKGRKVFYDCEHFFDAYKANPDYALKTLLCAQDAGASAIVLCDTNGGTLTKDILRIIKEISPKIKVGLGIHEHNDLGLGVANSIAAVEAGCTQVQGTMNGYGERCGNADLMTIIG
ncbi:MAG: citramalate synthase, partial [Candidatus Omnitrophica bacterium]|nr:citramalate synthase [Candidatus Omnitrophota bacterium]